MLYNVKEVSKCLGINIHLVYALIRKGLLPALKLGSLKVRRASLESFISKYEGMDTDTDAYEVVPGDEVENTLRKYRKESLLS